jgi:DNA-binding transcriptional regulator LsrR (DeoR family)
MPAERLPMRQVREVLRLHHVCGQSGHRIAAAVGISRYTVAEYLRRAAVVGSEVFVDGAIAQHVVDCGEHGGGHGANGLLRPPPVPQPLELRLVVAALLAHRRPGALHQHGLQPRRALAQAIGTALARTLVVARAHAGPGQQMPSGWEAAHVDAGLGDDNLSA